MNILILGGTGTMGRHLTTLLSQRGNFCWVTSRSKRENKENIYYVQGNAHNKQFLQQTLNQRHWDAIVDFMYYSTKEFTQIYKILLEHTRQYIYISSARVYADVKGPIKEDSPRLLDCCNDVNYLKTDEYALAKARQEDLLKQSTYNNWIIVRPYITYAEYTFQLSPIRKEFWLNRALRGHSIIFSNDIALKHTAFTYGKDVSKGIASLIGNYEANGSAFHITNPEIITWQEILEIYKKCIYELTGIKVKVTYIDKWTPILTGTKEQIKYDRLYDRVFDCSNISHYIDINSFSTVEHGIKQCLAIFLQNIKWDGKIDWAHEAALDRISGDWLKWNYFLKELSIREKAQYLIYRSGIKKW